MPGPRSRMIVAVGVMLLIAAVIAVPASIPAVRTFFTADNLKMVVAQAGWWGPVAFVAIMALAIVVSPLPNVPITAVLGMAYGPVGGTAIAVGGALFGAMIAFGIARRFGERAIAALVGRPVYFCEGCSERTLSTIVLVARLLPVVSFDIVSYGAGLSRLPFGRFVVTSFIGMIPWSFFYTMFGSSLIEHPRRATLIGVLLAAAVLGIPELIRRFNPFGLRRLLMAPAAEAPQERSHDER